MKKTETKPGGYDAVIDELHRVKREISAEHGNDVRSLAEELQNRQRGLTNLVAPPERKARAGA